MYIKKSDGVLSLDMHRLKFVVVEDECGEYRLQCDRKSVTKNGEDEFNCFPGIEGEGDASCQKIRTAENYVIIIQFFLNELNKSNAGQQVSVRVAKKVPTIVVRNNDFFFKIK